MLDTIGVTVSDPTADGDRKGGRAGQVDEEGEEKHWKRGPVGADW